MSFLRRVCERCGNPSCSCYRIGGRSQYLCVSCALNAQVDEQRKDKEDRA